MWVASPWVKIIYRRYISGRGMGDELSPLFSFLLLNRGKDERLREIIVLALARMFLLRGNLHLALAFTRLAGSFQAERDPKLKAALSITRAAISAMRGGLEGAERLLKCAFIASLRCGEMSLVLESALHFATVLARKGDALKALGFAAIARTVCESISCRRGPFDDVQSGAVGEIELVSVELVNAEAELERGEMDKAAEHAAAALAEAGRLGLGREYLQGLCLLSDMSIREKRYEDARAFIEEGLARSMLAKRFLAQRQSLYALKSLLCSALGREKEAEEAKREAERIRSSYSLECIYLNRVVEGAQEGERAYRGSDAHEPASGYFGTGKLLFKEQFLPNDNMAGGRKLRGGRDGENALFGARPGADIDDGIFLTSDPTLATLLSRIKDASTLPVPMLIAGETGVGKEAVARFVHRWSGRGDRPFVALNAAAIPPDLFESILFGHRRGAFTGAFAASRGIFEEAEDGTIFIDEIGELPVPLQAKLLRVVESGEYMALGESESKYSGARVIAATNRCLGEEVRRGNFRSDLYHRISVLSFTVPPLRERVSDVKLLANHFLGTFAERLGIETPAFSARALRVLSNYHWPGNVRELKGEVLRSALRAGSGEVKTFHLSRNILVESARREGAAGDLEDRLRAVEFDAIFKALEASAWVVAEAARSLGVKRTTLLYRMKRLGIS